MELGAWDALLREETEKPYFKALTEAVEREYRTQTVYPPREQLFAAFFKTPPAQVRVVILGQDPYHEAGQAQGLAFSVPAGVKLPPSLKNIFAERQTDLGLAAPDCGDLSAWAAQGVFLLNSVLSVRAGLANSHKSLGWQEFTDAVVAKICSLPQPIAFVLWGAQAQKKAEIAKKGAYPRLVLCAPHPSPLSAYRGFFGSRPFSKINDFLQQNGQKPIQW